MSSQLHILRHFKVQGGSHGNLCGDPEVSRVLIADVLMAVDGAIEYKTVAGHVSNSRNHGLSGILQRPPSSIISPLLCRE